MRQAERIKEKVSLHLEGRQIALLVFFALAVSGGVFWAGFQLGRESAPKPTLTASVLDAPIAVEPAPPAAKPAAPAPAAPPKYTYDRTLTQPTPPVQIDDETLRIVHEKREALAAEDKDKAQRALDTFAATGHAGTAFEGKRLPGGPGADAPAGRAPAAAPKPASEDEHARLDEGGVGDDEPAAPIEPPPAPAAGAPGEKAFTIQIKAFRAHDEAREFMAMLGQSGHKPYLATADVPGKGRFYRVRLGKFATMEAAERKRKAFERAEGFQTIVTQF